MTIRAIETHYKNYRFRSRLEARWAVFFDALGLEWDYEKEGYRLSDGTLYLPDFWLPALDIWIEVKPNTPTHSELDLMAKFRDDDQPIAMVMGIPKLYPGIAGVIWCNDITDSSGGTSDFLFSFVTDWKGVLYIETKGHRERTFYGQTNFDTILRRVTHQGVFGKGSDTLIAQAVNAARSARFEHGEKP